MYGFKSHFNDTCKWGLQDLSSRASVTKAITTEFSDLMKKQPVMPCPRISDSPTTASLSRLTALYGSHCEGLSVLQILATLSGGVELNPSELPSHRVSIHRRPASLLGSWASVMTGCKCGFWLSVWNGCHLPAVIHKGLMTGREGTCHRLELANGRQRGDEGGGRRG